MRMAADPALLTPTFPRLTKGCSSRSAADRLSKGTPFADRRVRAAVRRGEENDMLRNIIRIVSFSAVLLALGCGGPQEYVVTGTERAAGADGTVIVEEIEGNRMVSVTLEHLPPPDRISQGATVYIVWIKPQGAAPTMAGRLEFDGDDRTGRMRATTPHQEFQVIVTAEVDATVASPSEIIVVRQDVTPAD